MNFIDKETEGVKILKSRDEIFVDYDKLLKLIKTYPNPTEKDYTKEWDHEIIIKSKIFLAERLKGLSSLIKYFVKKNNVNNLNKIDYERVLNRMDKFLTKKNVKKRYIYYLPMYSRLSHKSQSHPDIKNLNNLRNSIKSIGEKYNFEFIDGSIPFMNVKNPLDIFPYQLPNHYNELGYKLLAEYANKKIF
tara:strand:+ start:798 stop:1367 length:570 start_codon:yes stop_codon:yes gene_type:complete